MELFNIKFKEEKPKYLQLANHIKGLIINNTLKDGERLPTIRALSKELEVNKVTIVNCYKKLQSDGYAFQKMGSGTYVKKREAINKIKIDYIKDIKKLKADNTNKLIDFTGESGKEVFFPIKDFKKIINNVLERDGSEALTTQETLGFLGLRNTINNVFWDFKISADNILVVSGAQQGIDIAVKTILNINDNVIVENPTYGGALSVLKWKNANIFYVPIKQTGINLVKFEEILKKNRIKCFYTMSYFHNPTGISYDRKTKERILELAEKYDFYIIEDDYLSEMIYSDNLKYEPFKIMDKNDRVIYIRSFSKVFLPGIRLGYMIYPKVLNEAMHNTKISTDIATSSLMQRALELYIRDGYFKYHIETVKSEYNNRYNIMKEELKKQLSNYVNYIDPKGGLTFYCTLKSKDINSDELFYRLRNKGVFITPGSIFYKNTEDGGNGFRLSFLQATEDNILQGIAIIKEELDKCHI